MGKSKAKKSSAAGADSKKAPKCSCEDPYKCFCGNRPERPSRGHKWYPAEQVWAGKGHQQKGGSGQTALVATAAKVTTKGKTTVAQWQRLPSQILADFCQRQKRPPPHYKKLPSSSQSDYKFRVLLKKDFIAKDADFVFVPVHAVSNEEQAKEEAALLGLLQLTPSLPHERKLPEPYRTTWLNAIAQQQKAKKKTTAPPPPQQTTESMSASSSQQKPQKAQASANLVSAVAIKTQERKEQKQRKLARMRKQEAIRMANRAHPVLMSCSIRQQVEALLRGENGLLLQNDDNDDTDDDESILLQRLIAEGFSRPQARAARAAVDPSTDDAEDDSVYEECLQWLLVHLDEEQLPSTYDPRGGGLDVVVAGTGGGGGGTTKKTSGDPVVNMLVSRLDITLPEAHRLVQVASSKKDEKKNNLSEEVLDLFWEAACIAGNVENKQEHLSASDEDDGLMDEEQEVMESIFGEAFSITSDKSVMRIADETVTVEVRVDPTTYPASTPPNRILVKGASFDVHVALATYARESLPLGEPMMFVLHAHLMTLVESPPETSPMPLSRALDSMRQGGTVQETVGSRKGEKKNTPPPQATRSRQTRGRRQQNKNSFWSLQPKQTPPAEAFPKLSSTMERTRSSLPAASARRDFLAALKNAKGRVLLVTGETGSGKSTQFPAYILEDNPTSAKIIVAQPRRLAATGVAGRVAQERGESKPGVQSVGYVVRGDSATSRNTRLLFCTTGVLLRQLQNEGALDCITHIVVDEVHERHLDSDILLGLLKENLANFPNLRVILMSATLDKEKFQNYWDSKPPHIHVPGRTFQVADHYLEDVLRLTGYVPPRKGKKSSNNRGGWDDPESNDDEIDPSSDDGGGGNGFSIQELIGRMDQSRVDYDLLARLVSQLIQTRDPSDDGSLLVFLAGAPEIGMAMDAIRRSTRGMALTLLQLHGGLQPREQNRVFEKPQRGFVKVILSTNVAETSITIPDVTIVIDTCREKQASYDPTNRMPMLVEKFASKASLRQRRGRAGRVRAGTAYCLISKKTFAKLDDHSIPEIQRVALDQTLLQLLFLGVEKGSGNFMQTLLDPPKKESLLAAIFSLEKLGAVKWQEKVLVLSPLGMHLAGIPAPPMIGKLLVMGSILGCRDMSLAMASALSVGRHPFIRINIPRKGRRDEPDEKESIEEMKNENIVKERDAYFKLVGNSDHALLAALFSQYKVTNEGQKKRFCDSLGLNPNCMRDINQLYRQMDTALITAGFESDHGANRNARSWRIVHACAIAAMSPSQLVKVKRPSTKYHETAEGAKEKDGEARELKFFIRSGDNDNEAADDIYGRTPEERVFVHPASANFSQGNYSFPYLVYHSLVRTSKPFLRDVTEATAYSMLMFGGSLEVKAAEEKIFIDDWVELSAHPRIGALVGGLRNRVDKLLSEKIENPRKEVSSSVEMNLIAKLIATDGLGK